MEMGGTEEVRLQRDYEVYSRPGSLALVVGLNE